MLKSLKTNPLLNPRPVALRTFLTFSESTSSSYIWIQIPHLTETQCLILQIIVRNICFWIA